MATKLKGLKIKRVALVDEGANPDAHIRFAKRNDPEPPADKPGDQEQDASFAKRIIDAIAKAFGISQAVEKADAQTFSEAQDAQKWQKVASEAMDTTYLFMESVRSILYDDEAESADKEQKMRQSIKEFAAAFETATTSWARGKSAEIKTEEAVVLAIKRNILKGLQDDPGIQEPETTPAQPPETTPTVKGIKAPATAKGDTDMQFDTTKMTPEEIATLEDLQKRFGQQEDKPADAPAAQPAEGKPSEEVSKSLAAVQAELETLRKFKTDAEEREIVAIAKKYELLGKKPEELAPVLKSMKQLGEDQYNSFIAMLDSNLDALEKSNAFSEIGKRGAGDNTSGAWGKIEAAATEIVKNKPGTTWEQAIDIACTTNPQLLEDYEKARA